MRKVLILVLVLLVGVTMGAVGSQMLNAQPAISSIPVATKGLHSTIKYEQVVASYLTDVNGKYKLRIGEITFDPGAEFGEHQHRGPGIRYLADGELTLVENGKKTVYKAGHYWFEPGNTTHSGSNTGPVKASLLQFELLPADLKGSSAFTPLK